MISICRTRRTRVLTLVALGTLTQLCRAAGPSDPESRAISDLLAGRFQWRVSQPVLGALQRPGFLTYAIKDEPEAPCHP
jgi:hypothetical protein